MNVLVTNANSRMALCLARALARVGHHVIVADYVPNAMTVYSRMISGHFIYPSPFSAPDAFLEVLRVQAKKLSIDVVIPVHEETFLIANHKDSLPFSTPCPLYASILEVHNKDRLATRLAKSGIRTPMSVPLSTIEDPETLRELISGPLALKPRQGGGNWAIRLLDQNRSYRSQVAEYLTVNAIDRERVLAQEWVPVDRKYSHVVLYRKGTFVLDFADIHLRDFPLHGGAGCLRQSCEPGNMTAMSRALFDDLKWHGIAEVEYVTHRDTGDLYLIEVNPRIWGGVNSAISSGLNIGDLLVRLALDQDISPIDFRRNIKTRWFWADVRGFPEYLSQSSSKIAGLKEFIMLMVDGTKSDEFYWDDPMPFFVWPAHALYKMLKYRSASSVAYDSLKGEWS